LPGLPDIHDSFARLAAKVAVAGLDAEHTAANTVETRQL